MSAHLVSYTAVSASCLVSKFNRLLGTRMTVTSDFSVQYSVPDLGSVLLHLALAS